MLSVACHCRMFFYMLLFSISEVNEQLLRIDSANLTFGKSYYMPLRTRQSDLCIPRNENARPGSQFPHSCICERYSQDRSAYMAAEN